ncbi:MAG: DNA-protecting protein DprA [Bacteroidetes bacterium]|nr:MAG: DNA-protecting protein DprA [Bacteroidota bacterium]TNE97971.1 MAG: DNA-protecting protein DprA [Bacteroidota bacterium]
MNYTDLHYQTALSLLFGIGPRRGKDLVEKLPDLERLFFDSPKNLSRSSGYRKELFEQMDRSGALESADSILRFNEKNNIDTRFYTDDLFPHRLNKTPDGPLVLYTLGDCDLNSGRFTAIVGTREPTGYGLDVCRQLVENLSDQNIRTVSGLAYGIDTWAHQFSLDNDIPTIAVLGHGLDRIYPHKNRALARKIVSRGGMLMTEFPPGTNPDRENFPKRNRLVAGVSDATIVIESKSSGGSLITARLANDYNRDVFAVPGMISMETSLGCNLLIANDEAHLYENPASFLEKMGWKNTSIKTEVQRTLFPELSSDELRIIQFVRSIRSAHVDVIAMKLQQPISSVQATLFLLEMKGLIRKLPGDQVEFIA